MSKPHVKRSYTQITLLILNIILGIAITAHSADITPPEISNVVITSSEVSKNSLKLCQCFSLMISLKLMMILILNKS